MTLIYKVATLTPFFPRRNSIALAALFLAAKVEEQPRKLEHVIKMAHICLYGRDAPPLDIRCVSEMTKKMSFVRTGLFTYSHWQTGDV
jgi:hypothetical protein